MDCIEDEADIFSDDKFIKLQEQKEILTEILIAKDPDSFVYDNVQLENFVSELLHYFNNEYDPEIMQSEDYEVNCWEKGYKRHSKASETYNEDQYYEELERNSESQAMICDEVSNVILNYSQTDNSQGTVWPLWSWYLQLDGDLLICENEEWINIRIPYKSFDIHSFVDSVLDAKVEHINKMHPEIQFKMRLKLQENQKGYFRFILLWKECKNKIDII